MSTLRQLLAWGEETLRQAQVPDAEVDAWELMETAFAVEKSCYFLQRDDKIEDTDRERQYRGFIEQRCRRIPLQQITGRAWFMGLEFEVSDQVLTPRFDTECLVEEVERLLVPGMRILDLCTGSGCILLSLLARNPRINGVGTDLSAGALQVACRNRDRLGIQAQLIQGDLFEHVTGSFDVIVSNPPYIPSKEIGGLMPEVRDHEPVMALDGGADGLDFYRRIIREAAGYLKPGGWLAFEIGCSQGEDLVRLLSEAGYTGVRTGRDLAGQVRTAFGQLPQKNTNTDNADGPAGPDGM